MVTHREQLAARYQRIVDDYMAEVEESVREFEETLKECTRQLEEAKKAQREGKENKTAALREPRKESSGSARIHGSRGIKGRIFD
ncbi:hypothetical protein [Corynebacterium sp. 22_2729]